MQTHDIILAKHGPDRIRQTKTRVIWERMGFGRYVKIQSVVRIDTLIDALFADWSYMHGDPRRTYWPGSSAPREVS